MTITDWPIKERPREKLIAQGASALSDAELLAIFLRTGTPGKTAVDLARELIMQFGNLRNLLEASQQHFCQSHGLGLAKYAQLQAALEIGRRYLEEDLQRKDVLRHSAATSAYITAQLRHYTYEVFACLFLDVRNRVISFKELFKGTLTHTSVHPREIVKRALTQNAAAVIFAHNHPSGTAEPSSADIAITQQLKKALDLIDVRVLDHIVVGEKQTTSLAKMGLI